MNFEKLFSLMASMHTYCLRSYGVNTRYVSNMWSPQEVAHGMGILTQSYGIGRDALGSIFDRVDARFTTLHCSPPLFAGVPFEPTGIFGNEPNSAMIQTSRNIFSFVMGNENYGWEVPADVFHMNVVFQRALLCVRVKADGLCAYEASPC